MTIHQPLEQRLRRALDVTAQTQVPDEQPVPTAPWASGDIAHRGANRRWLVPLAAIGVTAVVVGIIVASAVRAPTPPSSPNTPPTRTDGLIPGVPTTPAAAGPGPVTLAGADLVVPDGWRAEYSPDRLSGPYTWCLGPQSSCPVMFHRYSPGSTGPVPERPVRGGDMYNVCQQTSPNPLVLKQAHSAILGRRHADYRMWTIECPGGTRTIAQYVISDPPAFELAATTTATGTRLASILAEMDAIAASARLPPTPTGLRLYDQGQVRSARATGDGFDIVLWRYSGSAVRDWVREDIVTPYHIPRSLLPREYTTRRLVGERLIVLTNGADVTQVIVPGG